MLLGVGLGPLAKSLSELASFIRKVDNLACKYYDPYDLETMDGIYCVRFSAKRLRTLFETVVGPVQTEKFYSELIETLWFYQDEHVKIWNGRKGKAEELAKCLDLWHHNLTKTPIVIDPNRFDRKGKMFEALKALIKDKERKGLEMSASSLSDLKKKLRKVGYEHVANRLKGKDGKAHLDIPYGQIYIL